jgi:hypothetical protein
VSTSISSAIAASARDLPGLRPAQDAGFGEHHEVRLVDAPEAPDMLAPGPIEEGPQHRLGIDRVGEDGGVGGGCHGGHGATPSWTTGATRRQQ